MIIYNYRLSIVKVSVLPFPRSRLELCNPQSANRDALNQRTTSSLGQHWCEHARYAKTLDDELYWPIVMPARPVTQADGKI
jgi:hypothetical protein